MRSNTYSVLVNLEGNYSPQLTKVGYAEAHEYAARVAAEGMGVYVVHHSFRLGGRDCKCCASNRHGELVDCL